MGESVEFKVKLDDQVSGAAKKGATAIGKMAQEMAKLSRATRSANTYETRFGKKTQSAAVNKWAANIKKANKQTWRRIELNKKLIAQDAKMRGMRAGGAGAAQAGGAASAGGMGAMLGRMVPLAALAAIATRAIQALGRAALAAGKAIAGAAIYMSDMRYSLTKFLGSAAAGKREMAALLDISDELGVSFRDAAQTFKSFVSAGMTADAAKEMVKFRADLTAVATTEKDLERLEEAFMQIEKAIATGRLEMDGFTSILAGLPGVTEDSIFAKLAPMMGKTVEELKKMQKTELPVPMLLKAIKAAFLEAVGKDKLGAVALEKQVESVGGAFKAFGNIAENALLRLGDEIAPMLKTELLPVLMDMAAALKSKEGKAAIKDLAKAIGVMVKMAIAMGKGIVDGFKFMMPGIIGIGKAISKLLGLGDTMGGMEAIFYGIGLAIGIIAGAIAGFVATIALVVSVFASIVGAVKAVIEWIGNLPTAISEAATDFLSGGKSLGSAIITGIIQGLTGGVSGVIMAIVDIARKAIGAAKGALAVKSPSKVFENIGANVAAGMEQGIAAGAPAVSAAAAGMINPSRMANAGGTTQNISAPAKIGITIQDSGDPQATAAAVAATLEARVAGMFQAATLQVGVVGNG